jgi:hypothetical protein
MGWDLCCPRRKEKHESFRAFGAIFLFLFVIFLFSGFLSLSLSGAAGWYESTLPRGVLDARYHYFAFFSSLFCLLRRSLWFVGTYHT